LAQSLYKKNDEKNRCWRRVERLVKHTMPVQWIAP